MSLRRQPQQARSRERVEQILDAADAIFLEMGFAAATTNHVAARAGVSIGALYRFFPDKDALLVALAARYGERMRALGAGLPSPSGRTLAEHIATGIEAFNALLVAWPGFRTLVEQARHPALQAGIDGQNAEMSDLIGTSILRFRPKMDPREREVVAEVSNLVLGTLQGLSLTRDEDFRRRVVAEMKCLVTAYLSVRLGIPADQALD